MEDINALLRRFAEAAERRGPQDIARARGESPSVGSGPMPGNVSSPPLILKAPGTPLPGGIGNTPAPDARDTAREIEQPSQAEPHTLVVLTALPSPERECVLEVFGGAWGTESREGALFRVAETRLGGDRLRVVVACQNEMGMVPAAILTMKALRAWVPSCIAMTGICAGVQGQVNKGDIVVANSVFDYGSGKLQGGRLSPDYSPVPMSPDVCSLIQDFSAQEQVLSEILDECPGPSKPDSPIRARVGALASGAAVVADERVVRQVTQHKRTLLGIDMEAYGVARAASEASRHPPTFLIVKAVADFADAEKDDAFQRFCSYASALFLRKFLQDHWGTVARFP